MRSLTLYYTLPILNKYIPISILAYIWTALYRITTRIIDVRIVVKNTSMIVIEWKQQSWMETTLVPIQRHLPPKTLRSGLRTYMQHIYTKEKGKSFFSVCVFVWLRDKGFIPKTCVCVNVRTCCLRNKVFSVVCFYSVVLLSRYLPMYDTVCCGVYF